MITVCFNCEINLLIFTMQWLCISTVYAMARCPSVCLSHVSVVETVKQIVKLFHH